VRLTDVELAEIRRYADLGVPTRSIEHRRKLLAELDAVKAELAAARAERDEARAGYDELRARMGYIRLEQAHPIKQAERRGFTRAVEALEAAPGTFQREAGKWLRKTTKESPL